MLSKEEILKRFDGKQLNFRADGRIEWMIV
jgi:hypothetical protein